MVAVALLVVAYYVVIFVGHGLICAFYPYDLNYAEGYVLNDALRLVRGLPVWSDIRQFPMVRSPYPPLYLAIVGALSTTNPSFLAARLVSLMSTVAIGVMLWQYARSRGALAVAAALGIWFGSTFVYQWGPLARVDMLGVALSVAAVLLVERRVTTPTLLIAALLCSLALLTKQTLLPAPIAIAAFLAWRRDLRSVWFALLILGVVGGVSAAFNLLSDGQYVQHVLFGNTTNPFRIDRMLELSGIFLLLNVCACCAGMWVLVGEARSGRPSVVAFYAPLAITTVLTIGNVSGDVNYFLEPTAALALLMAPAATTVPRPLFAGLLCLQLALLFHVPNGFMSQFPPGPAKGSTPVPGDILAGDQVLAAIRAADGPTLVEPAGFSVLAGSTVWFQPIDLTAEQRRGRWTPDAMVASVEEQRWALVALNYKFLPSEVLDAIERTYELTDGIPSPNGFSYFIYQPRPGTDSPEAPRVTGITAAGLAP